VSQQSFSIAYSGTDRRDDHTMDVETLAPALLGVGRLIHIANLEFNGSRATAQVKIVSDFEHRCFNINFESIVTALDNAKTILSITGDGLKNARELLEQIGIIRTGAAFGGGMSLYAYLRHRKGRKVESANLIDKAEGGEVSLKLEGDRNSITINNNIYKMSNNHDALTSVRDTFAPLGIDGFDTMEAHGIVDGMDERLVIGPEGAQDILASCNTGIAEADVIEPDIVQTTAWLTVYSPVFDESAKTWKFRFNGKTILADISGTKIAENAVTRGGAAMDDSYEVRLEITTQRELSGRRGTPRYRILKVNKFVPGSPAAQASLFET
jgi:hypothetical protein